MNKYFITLLFSASSLAFTLVGTVTATFERAEINVYVGDQGCANVDTDLSELESIVKAGVDKFWNRVATSDLELRYGGAIGVNSSFYTDEICSNSTSFKPIMDKFNGEHKAVTAGCAGTAVPQVSEGILIVCNQDTASFDNNKNVIAVALPNNISGTTFKGSVIGINDAYADSAWTVIDRDERISALAHEIGHAFGLGHSAYKDSLMYPRSLSGRSRLGRDDWDGASFLYPKKQGPAAFCGTITTDNDSNSGPGAMTLALLVLILSFFAINLKILRR